MVFAPLSVDRRLHGVFKEMMFSVSWRALALDYRSQRVSSAALAFLIKGIQRVGLIYMQDSIELLGEGCIEIVSAPLSVLDVLYANGAF